MAQFADYYIRYKYDFAPYEWENRQSHLAVLFAEDSTIVFGEGDPSEEQQQEGIPMPKYLTIAFIIWRLTPISS